MILFHNQIRDILSIFRTSVAEPALKSKDCPGKFLSVPTSSIKLVNTRSFVILIEISLPKNWKNIFVTFNVSVNGYTVLLNIRQNDLPTTENFFIARSNTIKLLFIFLIKLFLNNIFITNFPNANTEFLIR